MGERDKDIDRLVELILASLGLDGRGPAGRWRARLKDLRRILAADYCGTVDSLRRSGALPVRSLVRAAKRDFADLNERPLRFDDIVRQRIAALGIALRLNAQPHRLALRAFYHRAGGTGALIWLNAAHPAPAVAASLGHELGHWYREQLLGAARETSTLAFFNSDFAEHLSRADELFADLFPVIAAYPHALARRIFPRGGWQQVLSGILRPDGVIDAVRAHLRSSYDYDLGEHRKFGPPRRLSYVTSMLHFARLRWAILDVCDV